MTAFSIDLTVTALVATVFALAFGGFSKGLLGVGLPMVTVPILTMFLPIRDVVAIMYFPILATNIWQALTGGYLVLALKRFWPLLLVLTILVWAGTLSLMSLDQDTVSIMLGLAVAIFAALSLANPTLRIPQRWERPLGVLAGGAAGFFGGLALIGGPPVIMYFVALHLKKEEFIGSIGLVYLLTLIPAGIAFVTLGVMETRHVLPGMATLIPVFAALAIGQWLRGRINQDLFRKLLLGSMVLIGLNLFQRGLF